MMPSAPTPGPPSHSGPAKHRILIVEDHPVVSRGLTQIIDSEADLSVCGVAEDFAPALEKQQALGPDLVILDLSLKGKDGFELLAQIKAGNPNQKVLILSIHDEEAYAARALRSGAKGYVMKTEPTEVLLAAIRKVLSGGNFLTARMQARAMRRVVKGRAAAMLEPWQQLTSREVQIFRLLGRGKSTLEIAELLCLRPRTIETHRTKIKDKLGLKSASELIQTAIKLELEAHHGFPRAGE